MPVISHAQMGATVRSAQQQATHLPESPCLVIVAIGGNDLLGPTTDVEFAERLETLLKQVSRPNRTLLMLELPLPPLRNEYGRIQRSLAQQYRVVLVPKRVMASVLTGPEATFDSIHLTTQGHAAMAAAMRWYVERLIAKVER